MTSPARLRRLPLLLVVLVSACQSSPTPASPPAGTTASAPELPSGWTPKATQYAQRDMVAAANPLAVDAGVIMLAKGGSAVDAAIAVQMMLTLVEPQSSGIGGGAFLLHYDPAGSQLVAYDGRETAPAAATPDMFLDASGNPLEFTRAVDGGLSVGRSTAAPPPRRSSTRCARIRPTLDG